jgi:poly [ADP-ribose] polymerase
MGHIDAAKSAFLKIYKDKTSKGYIEIEISYESKDDKKKESKRDPSKEAKCTLEKSVQGLMEMIYNIDMMNTHMREIGYDVKKLPLGKLGEGTLRKGYEILKKIEEILTGKRKGDIAVLTSEFYTHIPHCFGFTNVSKFKIDNKTILMEKLAMIDSLRDISIATKIIDESKESEEETSLYDVYYNKLNCTINPLKPEVN